MSGFALKPSNFSYTFSDDLDEGNEAQSGGAIRHPALAIFSKLLCVLTLCLLMAGALVTSHEAGLSVPDWPTSFGHNMFLFPVSEWQGGIFYEHVHRLIASGIGALTVILAVWLLLVEDRKWVKWLGGCAVLAVILQGVLGGMTVLYQLPTAISSFHAVLGQTFFLLTILIAYSQSEEISNPPINPIGIGSFLSIRRGYLIKSGIITIALIYMQLVLGAVMRHSGAGLAIPDFPTMGGRLLPIFDGDTLAEINRLRELIGLTGVTSAQVLVHFAHRLSGLIVVLSVVGLTISVLKSRSAPQFLVRNALYLFGIVLTQFSLGVLTIWSYKNPIITSFHVAGGALLLGFTFLLTIRLYFLRFPSATTR